MTTLRERPLNVTGQEVRAIIAGHKTQTRRVLRLQPPSGAEIRVGLFRPTKIDRHGNEYLSNKTVFGAYSLDGEWRLRCPYGQPGDLLWLRETFKDHTNDLPDLAPGETVVLYQADDPYPDEICWTPSTQMPRWASRIDLRIKSVRIERLQEISEADAMAEGARPLPLQSADDPSAWWEIDFGQHQCRTPRGVIRSLWQSSWDANPWVWVIEHERITK